MSVIHERAYAKVNLCLLLGPPRADGRHELVTVYESVDLADELQIEVPSLTGSDAVSCPAVEGPNLVSDALIALRAAGWGAPPVSVEIAKRIPVAAGLGGGSADAAALLRCAPGLAALEPSVTTTIAASLGADVPSQLDPGPSLGTGAGEIVRPLSPFEPHALLVIPQPFGLSTADVYGEADRLGIGRSSEALASQLAELASGLASGGSEPALPPLVNDLQQAAVSLAPEIESALEAAIDAGCESAIVCGSGPSVIGLCRGPSGAEHIDEARAAIADRFPSAIAVHPIRRGDGARAANP